ncbi:MAG: PTS lactose/cellobiose transporter subunit IIA [Bacillota bacterium]
MDFETIVFTLIANSGEVRSLSMEAIHFARNGEYEKAESCIKEADEKLGAAHTIQTSLIQNEAQGSETKVTLLLVHAQDHLMNAITIKDMANEFIELYKTVSCK